MILDYDRRRDGPRLCTGPIPPHRESPAYRRPADHNEAGLLVDGPEGEHDTLDPLVYFTHCAISASTPENERLQYVRYRGRKAAENAERTVTNGGLYRRPVKPANSGRKRKVA